MLDQDDTFFCADLIDRFATEANRSHALKDDDGEMFEMAVHELRTMPPQNLSTLTIGVACGVIDAYLKRSSNLKLDADEIRLMHSIRRRIRESMERKRTYH